MRRFLKLTDNDVVLACLPLFHVFGMTCAMNAAFAAGADAVVDRTLPSGEGDRADPSRPRDGVRGGAHHVLGAARPLPISFAPEATATLRTCVSGGAALPVAVLNDFEKTFDAVVLEGYGLSETSPAATFNHPDAERRPGSIGTPIDGVQMRLVDANGDRSRPPGSPERFRSRAPTS